MFERRLKILLLILVLATAVLALRALKIQGFDRDDWTNEANKTLTRPEYTETTRGAIRDFTGQAVALDVPGIDACVDYRAITEEPDAAWVRQQAENNLHARLGDGYGAAKRSKDWQRTLDGEIAAVKYQISDMWAKLATIAEAQGKSAADVDEIRRLIVQRVQMRKLSVEYHYQHAGDKAEKTDPWYEEILSGGDGASPDSDNVLEIGDERQPHVILQALDSQQQADLLHNLDKYPGLQLLPSKHRVYPFGRTACHVLGRLGIVNKEDIDNDPFMNDELRKFHLNDLTGRGGLEGLCEKVLRGKRGRVEKVAGGNKTITSVDPEPGRDVTMTIDIEMESEIEQAFEMERRHVDKDGVEIRQNQHGAAVVIDVATGEVRAMVSNPGFDLNSWDDEYAALNRNKLDRPLLNRATELPLEPGSTVKTIVGCGAITHGFMTPESTVECTGYLVLGGRRMTNGARCWVASQYESVLGKEGVKHHPVPYSDPHPTGFLTITDGLERSCNVVFETIADKMGMQELVYWFDRFGLGRKTGVGVAESTGMIPEPVNPAEHSAEKMWTWYAGIGQGRVQATPIQMANVAATIARNGIWMRPHLVQPRDEGADGVQRVDLHIAPEALAAVREGMVRVVNSLAGTGTGIRPDQQEPPLEHDLLQGITIAGKTGTAQTGILTIPRLDANGEEIRVKGVLQLQRVELGTEGTQKWYIGVGNDHKHLDHAWFIGFAPAEHPQVAFCVMVEYGGSGGRVAGAIAHDVLEACVRHGYLGPARPETLSDAR